MSATTIDARPAMAERLLKALSGQGAREAIKGHLKILLPSGRAIDIGRPCAEPSGEIHVRSYKALWWSIRSGSLGLCEAYVEGYWDSPDPARVFAFCLANGALLERASHVVSFKYAVSLKSLLDRARHRLRANNRRGSKRNIEAHYDLGNDFYKLWLDETMTYSAAWFGGGAQDLEAAQHAKYRLVLDALGFARGQTLLEIGCGWGGLAHAAAQRGAEVTGITLSEEQLTFAKQRLQGKADLRLQDYRDVQGTFDRIASIEMIEAVGEAYWPRYFRALSDLLKPGGVVAIQAITIDQPLFSIYRRGVDFIQRHIFPGGMLPTTGLLEQHAKAAGLIYEPVLSFGQDYARTLLCWRERFEAAWPQIEALGFDDRFRRKWRLYLAYCEEGFRARTIDVGLYRLIKR